MVSGLSLKYLDRISSSLGASLRALGASSGALGDVINLREPLFSKNERFTSARARFSKPVRARTGSELLRERMLSRGIEKRAATDSEQMRPFPRLNL